MMGAKNLSSTGRGPTEAGGLVWKVMRNEKRVTHVKISLDFSDTYTVRFLKQKRAPSYEVVTLAEHEGVYVDMLHELISSETGLALSL